MQTEDQLHSQLVGDCVLSLTAGIANMATWEHAPFAWKSLRYPNPLGVGLA